MGETTELTAEVKQLLAPISKERPAGESLRYEGTYDRIREARRADDPDVTWPVPKAGFKKADWNAVNDLCVNALQHRSKDVQVAVWLLEAWLHLHGYAGVRDGLRLVEGLCERFWAKLYPLVEGADLEARLAPLEWLNEKVLLALKDIPITHPPSQVEEAAPYTWGHWERALHREQVLRTQGRDGLAAGEVDTAQFLSNAALSPTAFFLKLAQDLSDALDALTGLKRTLREKCGDEAPSLGRFEETLQAIHSLIQDELEKRKELEPKEGTAPARIIEEEGQTGLAHEEEEALAEGDSEDEGEKPAARRIRSRAEAYRLLSEVAAYLHKNEPHSPTPYLVQRAVSWGNMTLEEIMRELSPSGQGALQGLLGLEEGGGDWISGKRTKLEEGEDD